MSKTQESYKTYRELVCGRDYRLTLLTNKRKNKYIKVILTYCGGSWYCEFGVFGGAWSTREADHRIRKTYHNLPIMCIEDTDS